jgi:hypothetical protein
MSVSNRRRRPSTPIQAEALETRQMLTGGVGNTFALVPATIEQPGGSVEIRFEVGPQHFTRPNGRVIVGIDVAAQRESQLDPKINTVAPVQEGVQNDRVGRREDGPRVQIQRSRQSSAILATLSRRTGGQNATDRFVVNVGGDKSTQGAGLVGFYLAGDADGNGTVDQKDVSLVRSLVGKTVDSVSYRFDADANRDGRIDGVDMNITRLNRGAKTTLSPVLSSNLDPSTDTEAQDRQTTSDKAIFTGQASAHATVTYQDVTGRAPAVSVKADDAGNYRIELPLALGVNTFRVTATDSFGQTISGQINPVIRPVA